MPIGHSDTTDMVAVQREAQALALRIEGKSYQSIADALHITRQGAYAAVKRALSAQAEDEAERVRHLREVESQRLDSLFERFYKDAMAPGSTSHSAARLCLKISERRSRLHGLDAPTRIRLEDPTELTDEDLLERVAAAYAASRPTLGRSTVAWIEDPPALAEEAEFSDVVPASAD